MKLINHRLDYSNPPKGWVWFTGNSFIKNNGALVMGRGAALQVRNLHPYKIDKAFGEHITHLCKYGTLYLHDFNVGIFQVKKHFKDNADLSLIEFSTKRLRDWARFHQQTQATRDMIHHINFPAIGNGHLDEADVMPIIEILPDNVFIYK